MTVCRSKDADDRRNARSATRRVEHGDADRAVHRGDAMM
jgi:hypothetical protein